VVIVAAADDRDRFHLASLNHLSQLSEEKLLASAALLEFDLLLRGKGYSENLRSEQFKLLLASYPRAASSVHHVSPTTFVLASSLEEQYGLGYFDSLIAAEAIQHDGQIVSSDRELDRVPGLQRISLEADS